MNRCCCSHQDQSWSPEKAPLCRGAARKKEDSTTRVFCSWNEFDSLMSWFDGVAVAWKNNTVRAEEKWPLSCQVKAFGPCDAPPIFRFDSSMNLLSRTKKTEEEDDFRGDASMHAKLLRFGEFVFWWLWYSRRWKKQNEVGVRIASQLRIANEWRRMTATGTRDRFSFNCWSE